MELRYVHAFCLAGPVSAARWGLIAILALLAARAILAVLLPLSADEAYYWLWSKHLDFGYFDHPPAIAWLIKSGTLIFGDSVIGVRFCGMVLSVAASGLVFESALAILKTRRRAFLAVLLFNLTLMINAEMLAATPDLPSVATSALFLFCLARLQQSGPPPLLREAHGGGGARSTLSSVRRAEGANGGRWWLAVGLAGGLGMLSKYAGGFLGLGVAAWLLADPRARRWLATPWPWAGGVLAVVIFLPNLIWQAGHQWETFVFQFGRIAGHQWTARYLIEFFGAQLGLASPLILVLGIVGLFRVRRGDDRFLLAMLMVPAIAYFLIHALHDRVQGNWPSFLFPAFAILAGDMLEDAIAGGRAFWLRWCSRLAVPLAALMLLLVYAQALTGILPLGKTDPLARLLGRGFRPVADSLPGAIQQAGAGAVITTDYETTAWLRFYQPGLAVIQADETYRYPNAPSPPPQLLSAPLLYVVETRRDRHALLEDYFRQVEPVRVLAIARNGEELGRYAIYLVAGAKGAIPSKMP